MRSGAIRGLAMVSLLATVPAGQAHHAYSANYVTDSVSEMEGVVKEVLWANPHAHYYIAVELEDGTSELWDVETFNLNRLYRMGWDRDSIVVGERIKVTGNPGRNGIRRIAGSIIEKSDGTVLRVSPPPSENEE